MGEFPASLSYKDRSCTQSVSDNVLIFGRTQREHDTKLHTALEKIQSAGVTLNKEKCEFNKDRLTFLGHVIDKQGVSPDPNKQQLLWPWRTPKLSQSSGDLWEW